MRNRVLAAFWMLIGMLAGFWMGLPFAAIIFKILRVFLGDQNPIIIPLGSIFFITPLLGACWFKHLFYKGELWGYKKDDNS
jgi:hypothetical protein